MEGCFDVTAIGISSFSVKYLCIQVNVVIVDSIIKSNCYHLWNPVTRPTIRTQPTRNSCPIFATEAVWELTDGQVTGRGSVRICVLACQSKKVLEEVLDHIQTSNQVNMYDLIKTIPLKVTIKKHFK